MKRIKFIDLSWKNPISLLFIIPSVIFLVFILLNTFEVFSFQNDQLNKVIFLLFFALQFIFFSRIFFFKNAFEYNKLAINLRINKFFPKNIRFSDIARIVFRENKFIITKFGGKSVEINLQNVLEDDKIKLKEIFKNHISPL